MISWYWVIEAFILGNAFTALTYEWFNWGDIWIEAIAALAMVVLYPILAIYNICFKNTIHPVSRERHEKLKAEWLQDRKSKCFNLGNNFAFWFDPQAKALFNKIFFVRITDKPIDK